MAAVKAFGRPQLDLYRDAALKPAQVIALAGIGPGMAVANLQPGNSYTPIGTTLNPIRVLVREFIT